MAQPTREKEGLLQALLQEYANAVLLYTNTISNTYTRVYGLLAGHGVLIAAFFVTPPVLEIKIAIIVIGFLLAILSYLTVEHVFLHAKFRMRQARDIEEKIE
jgi:hypothetical protein